MNLYCVECSMFTKNKDIKMKQELSYCLKFTKKQKVQTLGLQRQIKDQ